MKDSIPEKSCFHLFPFCKDLISVSSRSSPVPDVVDPDNGDTVATGGNAEEARDSEMLDLGKSGEQYVSGNKGGDMVRNFNSLHGYKKGYVQMSIIKKIFYFFASFLDIHGYLRLISRPKREHQKIYKRN